MKEKKLDPKDLALRKHGALNPNPQKVQDDKFQSSVFFDPRDLVQVKYEMVRLVKEETKSVTGATRAFGFSRPSFYQAQVALERKGLPGLLPQRPGPRRAHKLTESVLAVVEQAQVEDPTLRSDDLVALVKSQFGLSVHSRSIERGLARRQKKRSRKPV